MFIDNRNQKWGRTTKARFYDDDLGLFTSTDPLLGDLDTPPSLHRYLYANANPLTFIDPTGLMSEEQDNGGLLGSFAQGAADFFSGVADIAAFGYDHFAEGHALESLGQDDGRRWRSWPGIHR